MKKEKVVFDNGNVRIYEYKSCVIVEKYNEFEVSGELQKIICETIVKNFGLNNPSIVYKKSSYSMSMEAQLYLLEFMKKYKGKIAYVSLTDSSALISNMASKTYMKDKVVGVFDNLDIAVKNVLQ
ncbi:MAG: hypothetical protein KDK36_11340 [Leptospiraceae bacterium]|nr:hypothetical protein [Leptospiraceae bacterium]